MERKRETRSIDRVNVGVWWRDRSDWDDHPLIIFLPWSKENSSTWFDHFSSIDQDKDQSRLFCLRWSMPPTVIDDERMFRIDLNSPRSFSLGWWWWGEEQEKEEEKRKIKTMTENLGKRIFLVINNREEECFLMATKIITYSSSSSSCSRLQCDWCVRILQLSLWALLLSWKENDGDDNDDNFSFSLFNIRYF